MGNFVAFVLEGFDDLHLLGHTRVVGEHFLEGFSPFVDVRGLFGEEVEETPFTREEALQKSRHVVRLPREESMVRGMESVAKEGERGKECGRDKKSGPENRTALMD